MPTMPQVTHITTRRAFVAATGFGGVSLYGLWAAYGAAPGPLALLGLDRAHGEPHTADAVAAAGKTEAVADQGAHSGHGAAPAGQGAAEFSRMTDEFIARYRLPDGSVHPRRLAAESAAGVDPHAGHAGMAMPSVPPDSDHAAPAEHSAAAMAPAGEQPIDVLMVAGKWYYLPATLRLDVGQAYRFRMMALDVAHGASIQFGRGGRMIRLRPGYLTETGLTFQRAGRYLMHCTVYCGQAHDMMQATIEVV